MNANKQGIQAHVGDVFRIPAGDGRTGLGQVIAISRDKTLFVAIFEPTLRPEQAVNVMALVGAAPLLLANTLDAKVWHGHWPVILNVAPNEHLPFPVFKEAVGSSDDRYLVSFDGRRRRRATDTEWESWPFRYVVAPIVVEKAFQAHHGIQPWEQRFDKLRYESVLAWAQTEV